MGNTVLLRRPAPGTVIYATGVLALAGLVAGATSPTYGIGLRDAGAGRTIPAAMASREEEASFSVPSALSEIRRRTALTWDQLAKLFDVSRRAVHGWSAGQTLKPSHLERVQAVFDRLKTIKEGPTFKVRQALLAEQQGGSSSPSAHLERGEPILMSNPDSFSARIPTSKSSTMKIVRT